MDETTHSDSFLVLARYASGFSCAIASGFLYSIKRVNPSLQLELSVGSLLAAILGAVIAGALWKFVSELSRRGKASLSAQDLRRRWTVFGVSAALLFGMMVLSYGLALKDVRGSAVLQVLQGITG